MPEHPKFDEGTQAIMREIASMAAKQALEEHWKTCPVHDLKAAVFGNGRPGLRREMIEVQQQLKEMKESPPPELIVLKQQLAEMRETSHDRRGAITSFLTLVMATLAGGLVVWGLQIFAMHAK